MLNNIMIGPDLLSIDLPLVSEWNSDIKIKIFKIQVNGWQLDIADNMMNKSIPDMRHAGYASLSVMVSFIEMIAKYYEGFIPVSPKVPFSRKYFKNGLDLIYGKDKFEEFQKDLIYENLRCGLYHIGLTSGNVRLSGDFEHGLEFDLGTLKINPHKLVKELKEYFDKYIIQIKKDSKLLENFTKRFDYDKQIETV